MKNKKNNRVGDKGMTQTTTALSFYDGFSRYPGPIVARWVMSRRARRGKEDPQRIGERFGRASVARPNGDVFWLHAASVGESLSLLPLIERLRVEQPEATPLITTGTRASAEMMAQRLPQGAIHQYAPVDTLEAVSRFFDHWHPCVLAIVESEIWPTMLTEAQRRGVKTALLSARISERSASGWAYARRSIAALLGRFDLILAQNKVVAGRLEALGADHVKVGGALKDSAAPLPVDKARLGVWMRRLARRPLWLAASTHAGDEEAVLDAHAVLREQFPGLLTCIAPRHPERGDAIAALVASRNLTLARRSRRERPPKNGGIFLIDVLGELGLWYRLTPVALIGGSFFDRCGHNPLEAARLGCAVVFGPDMASFESESERLIDASAAKRTVADQISGTIAPLLQADGGRNALAAKMGAAAIAACGDGRETLQRHLDAITDLAAQTKRTTG